MKRIYFLGVALLLMAAIQLPAWGQIPSATVEYNAYMQAFNEPDPQKQIAFGEKFLTDYPNTQYKRDTYVVLIKAYTAVGICPKIAETADRMANVPGVTEAYRSNYYASAMECAQAKGDVPKTIEYGDKTLSLDANNLNAQLVLATTIPENLPAETDAKQAALTKAEGLTKKAIAGVTALGPAQGITDVQKNGLLGQLHASLGLISLTREDYDKSIASYLESIKLVPKDWVARYRLGVAYRSQLPPKTKAVMDAVTAENEGIKKRIDQIQLDDLRARREGLEFLFREHREKAIEQFAFAVAIGGAQAQPAKAELDRLWKQKNNESLAGLDAYINQKKSELGGN